MEMHAVLWTKGKLGQDIESAFRRGRVKVQLAQSLAAARQVLGKSTDVVLLDMSMPNMRGHEVINVLKASVDRKIPVVLVVRKITDLPEAVRTMVSQHSTVDTASDAREAYVSARRLVKSRHWRIADPRVRIRRTLAARKSPPRATAAQGQPGNFGLRHVVPELHDPESGRLNAKNVSDLFGITVAEVARTIGHSVATVHKTPDGPGLQSGLGIFERIAAPLLHLAGSPERLRMWLNAPNPELESRAPIQLIREGKGSFIADMVEGILVGQPR